MRPAIRKFPKLRTAAFAIAAVAFATVPTRAPAQGAPEASFRVLINGAVAGTAASVSNLPSDTVTMHQNTNPNLPPQQIASGGQGNVVVTTSDPALIAAIQAWMKADNSGLKDTVEHKTVEIDRLMGTGAASKYRLSDAWPSRLDAGTAGSSTITIVYQRLDIIP